MRKGIAFCVFCVVAGALCFAQSTTDGAIGGTVFDKTGAAVGNAKIVVHNNGTNAEQTVDADSSGYYRVGGLQPGSYTVTISGGGLATYKAEKVIVEVGTLTEVSPHLLVGGSQETVEVTAEAPQINYTSPEFAPVLDQTAISNLPINGGRWSSFALLTPGVVSDSNGFGLLSFRGISTLLNNNTVDGADNNQAFFSEERGRTRAGYSTAKVAVQEFQVNTSNYSAEYGRSAGGVVNTVTKSGTNSIHGEGYFYDRDNDWGAANAFTAINVQTAPGVFTSQNFKPTDWRKMAGFGVGGPLIKDKLFFYLAYDWYHHNFPGVAVASNPNVFFATPSAATVGTLATRLGVTNAQATTIYNNDLAGLNTMLGQVPRTGAQNILFPKLDWTINSKNHASFSFNRMRWSSPAGIQTASTVTRGIASFGNDFVKDTWGVAKLDTFLTTNFGNELRFQYGRDFEFEFSQPPTPYELANLVNAPSFTNPLGLPPTVSITNGFTFGVPNFLQRSSFPDENRTQIADTMTWTHSKHTFKYGVDMSHVNDNSQNLFNGFGSYSYSSLLNYFSDLNKPNTCAGKPCYSSYSQGLGSPGLEFTSNDYALFAQDDWRILPHLSLSFGLRYEYQQMPKAVASLVNPAVPQTGVLPKDHNNFGPRVGFAWDITGSGKTVLRGGYGIYYGRIINSTIFNALISTGMPGSQVSLSFTPTSAGAPVFPAILTSLSGAGRNITFFNSHFQNPQIHQMDLTLEREVGWGTVVSVSYLGSLGRELPNFADTNICTSTSQMTVLASGAPGPPCAAPGTITYNVIGGGPISSATVTEPLFKQRVDARFGSMTSIFSGTNSSYHALVFQVNHRLSHNIQFSANYTWSHAIDFGQNQSTFSDTNDLLVPFNILAEKGNSIYDVPNRFVANAVITSPWKKNGWAAWFVNNWELDPIFSIQNGLPFSLTTAGTPAGALGSSINGSGGANRIDVVGRNTFRLPSTWVQDLRLAKYLSVREKFKVELLGDFFNIANKQNVTGENNTGYIISGTSLTFNTPFGVPNNSNSNFSYSPRQIQLGIRVQY
ncbi:MAG TPA: TonB-dependent receptor [Candidatus Angelobacter sp.]